MNRVRAVIRQEAKGAQRDAVEAVRCVTWRPGPSVLAGGAGWLGRSPVEPDVIRDGGQGPCLGTVEAALAQVWGRWERLVDQLGGAVPAGQLRALLVIDASGTSPVARLAGALGMSVSGAGRLCDCLEGAGLVAWELAARSDPQIVVAATEAGQRLAAWGRDEQGGPPGPDPRTEQTCCCL